MYRAILLAVLAFHPLAAAAEEDPFELVNHLSGTATGSGEVREGKVDSVMLTGPRVDDALLLRVCRHESIRDLRLESINVSAEAYRDLKNLKQLRYLGMYKTANIPDSAFTALTGLTELEEVYFDAVPIGDQGLAGFANAAKLKQITLGGSKVEGPGLVHLRGLKELERLTIWNSPLASGLEHLNELPKLNYLHLGSTGVSDEQLKTVGRLSQVRTLTLSNLTFSDAGIGHLKGMTSLEFLNVSIARGFTGVGFSELKELRNLQRLQLFGTEVTDESLKHIAQLPALERLSLSSTKVSDAGLEHLHGMKQLKQVELWSNQVATQAGREALKQALPECEVSGWLGGRLPPPGVQ